MFRLATILAKHIKNPNRVEVREKGKKVVRPLKDKDIQIVVVVIQDSSGRILVVRRSEADDKTGQWETPGGHREPGETLEQAGIREVQEETGYEVKIIQGRRVFFKTPDGKYGVMLRGVITGGRFRLEEKEHDLAVWLDRSKLKILKRYPTPEDFVRELRIITANLFREDSVRYLGKSQANSKPKALVKAMSETKTPWYDDLPGGKGDDTSLGDFDPEEVAEGLSVETEHTDDLAIAEDIVRDHLTEDPRYYKKLKKVEVRKAVANERPPLISGLIKLTSSPTLLKTRSGWSPNKLAIAFRLSNVEFKALVAAGVFGVEINPQQLQANVQAWLQPPRQASKKLQAGEKGSYREQEEAEEQNPEDIAEETGIYKDSTPAWEAVWHLALQKSPDYANFALNQPVDTEKDYLGPLGKDEPDLPSGEKNTVHRTVREIVSSLGITDSVEVSIQSRRASRICSLDTKLLGKLGRRLCKYGFNTKFIDRYNLLASVSGQTNPTAPELNVTVTPPSAQKIRQEMGPGAKVSPGPGGTVDITTQNPNDVAKLTTPSGSSSSGGYTKTSY